ncbi:MAG: transporter substrate-binding domain-containing protein [Desulfobacula sp.]|jgi:polar amino acid transport system substrate-binding protein|nr:transporter substrate-binding domain-containing protein [Desulfobacula sp.]
MKVLRIFIVTLVLLSNFSQGIAEEKTVSLAVLDWKPYAGEELEKFGFGSKILTAAFNRAGFKVKFSFMPWVRALKDTEIGKYDAVCYGYYSDSRAKIYALSNSFIESSLVFCKHKDSNISYHSLQDLKPYRIGVVRGYVNTEQFDAADYLKKEEASNDTLNLKKLLNRRVDLILIDKFVAQYLLNTIFYKNKSDFEFILPPLKIHPLYVMFSKKVKNYDQKLKDFNNGLEQIITDGTRIKIMESHGFTKE